MSEDQNSHTATNDPDSTGVIGIVSAMIPASDLSVSVAWYADLLGMRHFREFRRDGVVTGAAIVSSQCSFIISFRLRSTIAKQPDLRGEHPIIVSVADRSALERIRARAEARGYHPTSGEHADAAWVEVLDPDGIALRIAVRTNFAPDFMGVDFLPNGEQQFYGSSTLELPTPQEVAE
ncbi:VOC family protein [Micromonospora chersina]|uniref:VOC family protein n=1 Tax=Micromonospora chersina TaxID=47854 RepID=UPI003721C491